MHLIATTLFCKIIFYVQHFLSMLDFIFFYSYNGLCDNTKQACCKELLKKKRCGKGKMALFTENYQEEMMHILKDMAHVCNAYQWHKEKQIADLSAKNAAKMDGLKLVWRHFMLKCVISTKQY